MQHMGEEEDSAEAVECNMWSFRQLAGKLASLF